MKILTSFLGFYFFGGGGLMKVYFLLYNDFMHECKFITIKDNQLVIPYTCISLCFLNGKLIKIITCLS